MSTSKKLLTIDQIKTELNNINYSIIENTYDPKNYKFDCVCPNKHITNVNFYRWKSNKNKCKLCPKIINKQDKIDIDFLKDEFKKNNCILLSDKYIGYDVKLNYICKNNHNTKMSYHLWKNNIHKCKECSKIDMNQRFKLSYNFVKSEFEKRNYILLSKEYNKKKDKLDFECPEGHIGNMSFNAFYYAKNNCLECSGSKKHTINEIKIILEKDNFKLLSTEYINNKTKLKLLCPKNHEFEMRLNDYITGYRCKFCCESVGEQKISNFLDKCDYVKYYDTEFKFSDCKNKSPLPFDFYLNDLFFIEFDGEQHFRNVDFFGGEEGFKLRQINDKIKTNYCRSNKIPFLRISYKQINEISQIIESFINDLKIDNTKIYFSDDILYNYLY